MASNGEVNLYATAKKLVAAEKYSDAFPIYRELANEGDPQCQVFLGWMYSKGLGVEKDQQQAIEWFKRAASLGSKEGAFYCGKVALGANHYSEGLEWLRKASTQEYGPALLWLGLAYVRGMGVSVDMGKGIAYLKRSADTGNFPARRELALLMIRGKLGLKRIPIGLALLPFAVISAIFDSVFKGDSDNLMG